MNSWIPKRTKFEITATSGIINRGKQTFPKIPALAEKVLEVPEKQAVKQFHIVIPAKLNKNGGTVPVEILATLLNIKVKITEVNKG